MGRGIALLGALLVTSAAVDARAQVTVRVDATKAWQGYMNWNDTDGNYVGGGAWAIADLRAEFEPTPETAAAVVLQVNTNTYDPGDIFWNNPDGSPNKLLEANFYVDVGTEFAGEEVTFLGTVDVNTLPEGWTCEAVIKEFAAGYNFIGDTRTLLVAGQPFTVSRSIGGGSICQYGFLTYGPNVEPGSPASLTSVRVLVDNSDPAITSGPANRRLPVGATAVFTSVATGQTALSYQWGVVEAGVTNALNDGGTVSGATTDTLTLSDVQESDSGTYVITVTNQAGTDSASATLAVKSAEDYVNVLENPGFEADLTGQSVSPWQRFESSAATAGYLQTKDDQYLFGGNVDVHEGTYVSFTVLHAAYSGIYQDAPAEPGQIFTGDIWFYNASGDPIPGGEGSGITNECYLEVQFRAGETVLQQYTTEIFDATLPRDQWINMAATRAGDYGTMPPESDATYLVAPEGTTKVRFQITLHDVAGSSGLGSLYYDSASLLLKESVALEVAQAAGSIELTWDTLAATDYQVQYTDDVAADAWTDAEVVPGTGGTVTRSYPPAGPQRTYRVLTL